MNWFPQLGQGSVAQFPFHKQRNWRAIRNDIESGEQILLPDAAGGLVAWTLSYKDLSDDEANQLKSLFALSLGSFASFGLVDPLVNLLAWSGDLTRPDWQSDQLTILGGGNDPDGGQSAWSLANSTPGDQQLVQTVGVPGEYVTCLSAWVRADTPCSITMQRDSVQVKVDVGKTWKRRFVGGTGVSGTQTATYSIAISAGLTVQLWNPQVEAQPYPSQFKASSSSRGIYPETYFATDELTVTDTAPGLHSCEIKLLSRV